MAVNDRRMCDDLDERIRQLDSRGATVKLERLLQEGAFGRVYQGAYKHKGGGSQEVLVKTVTGELYTTCLLLELSRLIIFFFVCVIVPIILYK